MFKILYCSDLHGNKKCYGKLVDYTNSHKNINAIVIGGDLCPHGYGDLNESISQQKEFIETFLIPKLKDCKKELFIMMGNDDFRVNMKLLEDAEKKGIFRLLNDKPKKISDKKIVGYGFVNETPFLLKDWEKLDDKESKQITEPKQDIRTMPAEKGTIEDDFKKIKNLAKPEETIYVIHAPPFDTNLDILPNLQHVGSKSVRKFIEENQPFLTLHGHIHESVVASGEFFDKLGSTICVNPGSDYLDDIIDAVIIDLDNLKDIEHEMI